MNLSAIDVNLVVALDALLRERSVTRAARRVGLSQPAMSHTLTRLREALGDPLLVRVGRQMTLTDRAEAMTGRVTALMQDLESLFGRTPEPFDPAESGRAFRVAASEYVLFVVLPPLHALFAHAAPRASLQALPLGEAPVVEGLRSGEIDLALGTFLPEAVPGDVRSAALIQDRYVGLAHVSHPKAHGRPDLEAYMSAAHLVVSPRAGRGDAVDELLARRGLSRRIAVTVPSFLVAPYVIAISELFATLPERVALAFSSALPLRRFDPPFELAAPEITMLWHDRTHHEPMHQWLRRMVGEASGHAFVGGRRKRG